MHTSRNGPIPWSRTSVIGCITSNDFRGAMKQKKRIMNKAILTLLMSVLFSAVLRAETVKVPILFRINDPGVRFRTVGAGFTSDAEKFNAFYKFIPWIALILLVFIGIKMIIEGIKDEAEKEAERSEKRLSFKMLLVQAVATSIDALSVGFTIADYKFVSALCASLIIGVVTWAICIGGLIIGKRFGMKFARIASYLGGAILIIIGIEIFVSHMFS